MTLDTGDTIMTAPVRMGQPGFANEGHNRFGLKGRSKSFDLRIIAIRPDLADIAVAGEHFAPHYAAPMMTSGMTPHVAMRSAPSSDAKQISELLYGEAYALLDVTGGWAWGYRHADHHVGYIAIDALGPAIAPTHRVSATETLLRSQADQASGGSAMLPRGAILMGDVQGEWLSVSNGYVPLSDLVEIENEAADPVDVAEALIGAPYQQGGRTMKGVDAAALVQLAWAEAGIRLPRDSDLQLAALNSGQDISASRLESSDLKRGDLVFFPGHVGIMADGQMLVHASRHWGEVRRERLSDVTARSAEENQDQPVLAYIRLR